jgi:hypothetical protein
MCKCVLPPGVNPIAVDKYIDITSISINKTDIKCVHGPISTPQAEQMNTLCIDSKAGLGVVAKRITRCSLSLPAAVQTGACQLGLCPEIGEISDEN